MTHFPNQDMAHHASAIAAETASWRVALVQSDQRLDLARGLSASLRRQVLLALVTLVSFAAHAQEVPPPSRSNAVPDTGVAAAPCGNCNLASKHTSTLGIDNGMGAYRWYSDLTESGVDAHLIESCDFYAEGHTTAGESLVTISCAVRNPRATGGANWSSAGVVASFAHYDRRNGKLLYTSNPSNYNTGTVVCDDALNISNTKTGTDGQCYCLAGMDWSTSFKGCVKTMDRWHIAQTTNDCAINPPKGNPIYPLTGSKRQVESLGFWIGGEEASLIFESLRLLPYRSGSGLNNGVPGFAPQGPGNLPRPWESSLHRQLYGYAQGIQAYRGGGHWVTFTKVGNSYIPDVNVRDSLGRSGTNWLYVDRTRNAEELYDASGRIQRATFADGRALTYSYSTAATPAAQAPVAGLLIDISDERGRSASLYYDAQGRIHQVLAPSGYTVGLDYTSLNTLAQLKWPDGESKRFLYERSDLPWALTGVIDERVERHSTFEYDTDGLSIGTTLHASPYVKAQSFQVSYGLDKPGWTVVERYDRPSGILWRDHYLTVAPDLSLSQPVGSSSSMRGTSILGSPRLSWQSQAAGSGCAASTSAQGFDANGNLSERDDFNGNRTCFVNGTRNLETVRVEGLTAGASCGVTTAGSLLPAGSRKISTQWHPDWSLPTRTAQPGKITSYIYNGQADPFAGGAAANCAPATAVLLDGNRLPLLCRLVEQATADLDGAAGLSAPIVATVPAREQKWTYNSIGQVLTHDGPLPGTSDTTTFIYFDNTEFSGPEPSAFGHTRGDLQQVIAPEGHITKFTLYNRAGQPVEVLDPNGVLVSSAYDARQRLIRSSVGGQVTLFEYWPTGQLKKVFQADGSFVTYHYDSAHRLIRVEDNNGNRIEYTLDSAGARIAENVIDQIGSLRRHLTRGVDALGRVQQLTGREPRP